MNFSPEQVIAKLESSPDTQEVVELYQDVVGFSQQVERAGGRAYLVGGAVRDQVLGVAPKDFDLEIHNLPASQVEALAQKLGPINSVGKSYGILKTRRGNHELDISLPRVETKIGEGHRDFSIGVVPDMGVKAAAHRRDFTIGAIYADILTGEVIDPYRGVDDLHRRELRMIDRKTFIEDKLRVLRGMQMVARFPLQVESKTLATMRAMVPEMGALSPERIRVEWQKLLLAPEPSRGLHLGRELGYLEQWQPELSALWTTPQDPQHHPEGDVWNHTLMVADRTGRIATDHQLSAESRLVIALGALTHDLGKPNTTRNLEGRFVSHGHEAAGVGPATALLRRLGIEQKIIDRVMPLVEDHLRPDQLFQASRTGIEPKLSAFLRLVRDIQPATLPELLALVTADKLGRGPFTRPDGLIAMPDHYDGAEWWAEKIAELKLNQPMEPILWGRDLVERGWTPGPAVGQAVRLADRMAVNGMSRAEVLQVIDSVDGSGETLSILQSLVQAEDL